MTQSLSVVAVSIMMVSSMKSTVAMDTISFAHTERITLPMVMPEMIFSKFTQLEIIMVVLATIFSGRPSAISTVARGMIS